MSRLPAKQRYIVKNRQKYLGRNIDKIICRSSWEYSFCLTCDFSPAVLGWASETLPTKTAHETGIAYRNPFYPGRQQTLYVPDFFIIYIDKNGKQHAEVIEIKPLDEVPPMFGGHRAKVGKLKEARRVVNTAKFMAAVEHCIKRGWVFRVMTEKDLFSSQRGKHRTK